MITKIETHKGHFQSKILHQWKWNWKAVRKCGNLILVTLIHFVRQALFKLLFNCQYAIYTTSVFVAQIRYRLNHRDSL
jgi:hypothetical protein